MTPQLSKQISLFTFVKAGDGYVKRTITLFDLVARLSDTNTNVARSIKKNITQPSDDTTLATSELTRSKNARTP